MQTRLLFTILSFSFLLSDLFAQNILNEQTKKRERENQNSVNNNSDYVDCYPDSLFYNNRILFFRSTPLLSKPGYSNLYIYDVEDLDEDMFPSYLTNGLKGYQIRWIVRNDSLFIHRIYVTYSGFSSKNLKYHSIDTINSRMEKFAGRKFFKGFLFAGWITDELRVISKFAGCNPSIFMGGEELFEYRDDRKYGSILTVKNGLIVDFKDDMTNAIPNQGNIVQREMDYESAKKRRYYYVDAEPDTLYHDGSLFFFRQTPLCLKQGYTDVYHENEVSIFNSSDTYIGGGFVGLKGYHLTWVTRNDSQYLPHILRS